MPEYLFLTHCFDRCLRSLAPCSALQSRADTKVGDYGTAVNGMVPTTGSLSWHFIIFLTFTKSIK